MGRCVGYPLWYFQTKGIAQAVSSYQATEFIEHMAASLSGQAKAVLQEVFKMTPTLTCALAKTTAQSQQQISQATGKAQATIKGLTIVCPSLLHG
jgi:hypothetical protein